MPTTKTILPAPAVICVAPNGARKTHEDHPALPLTPAQIAADAQACAEAGANMLHLHVRDALFRHSLEAEHYRAALQALGQRLTRPLLLQLTTEAVGLYRPAQQIALLHTLRPAAASIALRELLPDAADLPAFDALCAWARREEVALQFIVYTPDEARQLVQLAQQGVLHVETPHALFVLGRYSTGLISEPRDVLDFLAHWPADWPWSLCAFGQTETQCLTVALGLGGHVRVGFENNLWRPDGETAQNNAERVAHLAALLPLAGRSTATPEDTLRLYGATRFH